MERMGSIWAQIFYNYKVGGGGDMKNMEEALRILNEDVDFGCKSNTSGSQYRRWGMKIIALIKEYGRLLQIVERLR